MITSATQTAFYSLSNSTNLSKSAANKMSKNFSLDNLKTQNTNSTLESLNSSDLNVANANSTPTQTAQNSRFKMLVEAKPVTSTIISKTANGDTIIGRWHPLVENGNFNEYITKLEASNSKVSSTPSRAEFDKAVQSISALMKDVMDFVRAEQGESQLDSDLAFLQNNHTSLLGLLSQTQWGTGDETYENLWMGAKMFFDYVSDKIASLPQSEIDKNIATIQSYLVSTSPNKNTLTNTQNALKFSLSSENLKANAQDSLLKVLLNSLSNDENLLKNLRV